MGLFDFLRGKPDEDPILGGREQQPTGLEVRPVEGAQPVQIDVQQLHQRGALTARFAAAKAKLLAG